MNDIQAITQVVGFLVQTVGLITVAVRTGSWKGHTDSRIDTLEKQSAENSKELAARGSLESRVDALEKQSAQTIQELSVVDKRVDGIEKELLKIMVGVQKDIEYIKKTIDKQKEKENA